MNIKQIIKEKGYVLDLPERIERQYRYSSKDLENFKKSPILYFAEWGDTDENMEFWDRISDNPTSILHCGRIYKEFGLMLRKTPKKKRPKVQFVIGKLTVLVGNVFMDGRKFFRCICDCGNECFLNSSSVIAEKTKSCGCLASESANEIAKKNREVADDKGKMLAYKDDSFIIGKDFTRNGKILYTKSKWFKLGEHYDFIETPESLTIKRADPFDILTSKEFTETNQFDFKGNSPEGIYRPHKSSTTKELVIYFNKLKDE